MSRRDYANARVQAVRGRLLGAVGLRELVARSGLAARIAFLRDTDYGEVLAEARLSRGGDELLPALDAALGARFRRDVQGIVDWLEGDPGQALVRAYLALDEAETVKVLVRALGRGVTAGRAIRAGGAGALALPATDLDAAAVVALEGETTAEGIARVLIARGNALGPALAAALRAGQPPGPALLEVALERAAVTRAFAAVAAARDREDAAILASAVALRVDLLNVRTLLEAESGLATPGEVFVECPVVRGAGAPAWALGGAPLARGAVLDGGAFSRLAAAPLSERQAAAARVLGRHLGARPEIAAALASPFRADQILAAGLERAFRRASRHHPLSIAVPLALLCERAGEVRRLRIAVRTAALGLPAADVLDLLEPAWLEAS